MVLNDDGNVLDALSLACLAALANTRIPRVEIVAGEDGEEPELELDDDMEHSMRVELKDVPVIVSVAQVANVMAVDLNLQEEACSGATMHVAVSLNLQAGLGPHSPLSHRPLIPWKCSLLDCPTILLQVNAKGRVCGTWKEGAKALDPSMLTAMMEFAQQAGPKLYGGIRNYVDGLEGMAA
jgi:exosome complex RNA-binding protein Rrp42 (RNase PH superfamily)